jgi:glycerol-3-phosphate dehydrogenase
MSLRRTAISRMKNGHVDVLVVGAGINGAVTAAALAGRGASVALIDRADFGGFTSQESSNLVWGGFKYLENYELPLVFGLCKSRNRLMKAYPDNVKEISFLATLDNTAPFKPWFAALGATAYWGIGQFGTKRPRLYDAEKLEAVEPTSTPPAPAAPCSTRTATWSTTTPGSSSPSSARPSRRGRPSPTTSSS